MSSFVIELEHEGKPKRFIRPGISIAQLRKAIQSNYGDKVVIIDIYKAGF